MFNLKKKVESTIEEVKEDIKDNVEYTIIGAAGAIIVSYAIGYLIGGRNSNKINININMIDKDRDLINNIINNK